MKQEDKTPLERAEERPILDMLSRQQNTLQNIQEILQRIEKAVCQQREGELTSVNPPMNNILRRQGYALCNRDNCGRNAVPGGGGGINYNRLTIQALVDINQSITAIGSLVKDICISRDIEQE